MKAISFVLISNTLCFFAVYGIEWSSGFFSIQFSSDYFFYSALTQWFIASFFMVIGKERNSIENSPAPWTKGATSMMEKVPEGDSLTSTSDISLSNRLFLSGVVSFIICFIL